MSVFADTSFLCALYHTQPGTEQADEYMKAAAVPLVVTGLIRFEFLQGTRIEAWRHEAQRRMEGYPLGEALALQLRFDDEVRAGRLQVLSRIGRPSFIWRIRFRSATRRRKATGALTSCISHRRRCWVLRNF